MSDRHQIIDDKEFWSRLEYDSSHWLERADDRALRRFWIDGFLPEVATDTTRGVNIEGTAWVGEGPRVQHSYRFLVTVPQKMLRRRRQTFSIEQLLLDERQQTLTIDIVSEKQVA